MDDSITHRPSLSNSHSKATYSNFWTTEAKDWLYSDMALNWAMLNPNRTPVPLPGEMTITTVDSGVDLLLTIPNAPPVGPSDTAGGSGGFQKMKAMGRVWLTDQRVRSVHRFHRVIPFD